MKQRSYLSAFLNLILLFSAHSFAGENNIASPTLGIQPTLALSIETLDQPVYSMFTSSGDKPGDLDVFISVRYRNEFSFKICSAHDSNGSKTEIANLKAYRYSKPEKFKDFTSSQQFMKEIFQDKNCKFVGNPIYGISATKPLPTISHGIFSSKDSQSLTGVAIVAGVGSIYGPFALEKVNQPIPNTLKTSRRMSLWLGNILTDKNYAKNRYILIASAAGAYFSYQFFWGDQSKKDYTSFWDKQTNEKICDIATVTYEHLDEKINPDIFIFDINTEKTCPMSAMSQFVQKINKGLRFAVDQKFLVPL